ncbi:MAG: hypothetical protein IT475_01105 [Aquimonas sp.]|nr:hypothetical protein [Aquimonas sp.]
MSKAMRKKSLGAAISLTFMTASPMLLADVWRIENVPQNQRAALQSQATRSYVYGDTI